MPTQNLKTQIQWIRPHLSRQEYVEMLHRADALLLPYDPILYASRTSGPFVEAISLNKAVFVRKGSWLANELLNYDLSEYILDWTDPLVPSRLWEAIHSSVATEKRTRMHHAYRAFHCAETFQKVLLSVTSH